MSSQNILILGTGAIGAFYASRLSTVSGTKVSAICRSNYNIIKNNGIRVTSPTFGDTTFKPAYTFANVAEAREFKKRESLLWDHLIVTTKVLGDPSVLAEGLVDEGTSVVVFQNGLGIEEPYWKRFPGRRIVSAVTRTSVSQPTPGHIEHAHWTRTTVGPYAPGASASDAEAAQGRVEEFADLLRKAGISDVDVLSHTGMQFARWHKTAINASINPTSVLAGGCTTQATGLDPELYAHVAGVMQEILDVAVQVLGAPLPETLPTIEAVLQGVKEDMSGSRPSMWHDWAAGRQVELEAILGNVLRQARDAGVQVPRTQTLYALLRMAQAMRDAKAPGP
ncbi:putative ketopantoate reductase ApbA/PanE, 6-phosphogluconate dehydrogenase-like domain superfamily [Septoria linicola]|nr:putative ketopantoate reductase ApbA/PanE, 6-phosphogluconate dehydrogenase-like domain superfamily [Septoria linicola]